MEEATKQEAQLLERYMQEFEIANGTKKGAMRHAARKVYGATVEESKAILRGHKTVQKWRKMIRTKLPT